MTDSEIKQLIIANTDPSSNTYLLVANAYTLAVYFQSDSQNRTYIASGEFGKESLAALAVAIKPKRVLWAQTDEPDPRSIDPASLSPVSTTKKDLEQWIKVASDVTTGRGGEADHKVRYEVGCLAGWHCQFEGCGANLRTQAQPWVNANFSYFAHIIASSPKGPRGDPVLSPMRSNDPDNLMLLCDKCHRLIDRVAPQDYPADMLFEMRRHNIDEVARLLGNLSYEAAQMVAIEEKIEGQGSGFNETTAEQAMWLSKLRRGSKECVHFMQNGHLSASSEDVYWLSLFKALEEDIPSLKRFLRGSDSNTGRPKHIALFPKHSISVLIITGRILGEASSIKQFQFHRDQVGGAIGGQWAWPKIPEPDKNKYQVTTDRNYETGYEEAFLRVYLTARIPDDDLPTHLFRNGQLKLPTITISIDQPTHKAISHPFDLELLGISIDRAYRLLQEDWRVKKVHLLAIAPTTACVRIGQKMQARHHAEFELYERHHAAPGKPFLATVRITSTHLHHASGRSIGIG